MIQDPMFFVAISAWSKIAAYGTLHKKNKNKGSVQKKQTLNGPGNSD